MKFDLFRRKARRDIIAAPELLRIESISPPVRFIFKCMLLIPLTVFYCLFLIGLFRTSISVLFNIAAMISFSLLYAFAVFLIMSNKKKELVFTEAGFIAPYSIAIRWSDIGAYKWQHFRGTSLTANAPKEGGMSILLFSKDWVMPILTNKGTTMFATWGIFFDKDQIIKTESILDKLGIKQTDWFKYE